MPFPERRYERQGAGDPIFGIQHFLCDLSPGTIGQWPTCVKDPKQWLFVQILCICCSLISLDCLVILSETICGAKSKGGIFAHETMACCNN
jgi:hypothetical protein